MGVESWPVYLRRREIRAVTPSGPRIVISALLALWVGSAAVHAAETEKTGLNFELSDGRRFVRLSGFSPQVTVINFWRYDCPPCLREMPVFAAQTGSGKARILTVALHRPAEDLLAPAAVRQALTTLQALYGPSEPRGLLARFGNPQGALPYTVLLNAQRQTCAQRTGEIDEAWLRAALIRCAANEGQA